MTTILLPTIQDTQHLGYLLGKHLPGNSTIFLKGDLGAGKTTLVQGIAKGLEIKDAIVSPTFTLVNEYIDGRLPLYHLDLYRLEPRQVDGIYPQMYWEGIEVAPGITAIEWSQRLEFAPASYLEIELLVLSQGRQARLQPHGKDSDNLKLICSFLQTT